MAVHSGHRYELWDQLRWESLAQSLTLWQGACLLLLLPYLQSTQHPQFRKEGILLASLTSSRHTVSLDSDQHLSELSLNQLLIPPTSTVTMAVGGGHAIYRLSSLEPVSKTILLKRSCGWVRTSSHISHPPSAGSRVGSLYSE